MKKREDLFILFARKPVAPVTRMVLFSRNSRTLPNSIGILKEEERKQKRERSRIDLRSDKQKVINVQEALKPPLVNKQESNVISFHINISSKIASEGTESN